MPHSGIKHHQNEEEAPDPCEPDAIYAGSAARTAFLTAQDSA
jgi:hypothetical protein